MKRLLALSALLVLFSVPLASADEGAPSNVELSDASSISVDWSKGHIQSVTLVGDRTLTFSNGQKGARYILILKQDATGSRAVTWPSSVRFPGATPIRLTATANKTDYITFFYNGVTYDAVSLTQNL